jgi:hypothetical protein
MECPGGGRKIGEEGVKNTEEERKREKSRQRRYEEALGETGLPEERGSNSDRL